ncbi:hypothetical protein GS399_03660 [Pedobacter sp. HMF7647]|uniref:Uncharacterized protein n=1 Tax=Hufsiella arboris TaxID=2695275 RepID=A0A7K1Y650_9SPHI|nr:hypothetical protein [Hufsiella arboris]MXV50056.1 hypothetical protein [Hufsiella arboris]
MSINGGHFNDHIDSILEQTIIQTSMLINPSQLTNTTYFSFPSSDE